MPRRKGPLNRKLYRDDVALDEKIIEKPDDLTLARRPSEPLTDEDSGNNRGEVKGVKAAVLASLLLGESPGRIAKQYNLSYHLVRDWQSEFDITNPVLRRDKLSEHLVTFIEQEIKNLLAIGIITSDEKWVSWQSAGELADFVQVKSATIMQLLTAFGRANQQAAELRQRQIDVVEP